MTKIMLLAMAAMVATAQRPGPPPEMVEACQGKAENASCNVQPPFGDNVAGTCRRGPRGEALLACVPSGGPPATKAEVIAGTQISTADILCAYQVNTISKYVQLPSIAQWSCTTTERTLSANGIPNHAVGQFPNSGNPNRIAVQNVQFTATLNPALRQGNSQRVKVAGYAINGIKFDPGTAQSCNENCENHGEDPIGKWRIEALNQSYFDFGVDENNAHVQPDGAYHYHGVPTGLLKAAGNNGQRMTLVGWAADGFPLYARFAYSHANDAHSGISELRSSFRVKTTPDSGRPATSIAPMGTFMQDYEYLADSGDLDECNGRSGVTPEFPKGTYYYVITQSYPYVPRCLKGNSVSRSRSNR